MASRPSPKLTLEQLQAEQAAYESQRQQQQQPPTAAAASSEEEEEGEELYYGGSSSGGAGGAGGRAGGTVQYGSSDAVPEVVTNRMLRRVILFMGTPVFGGILLFPFFYWLKVRGGVEKLGEGSGSRLSRWLMQGCPRVRAIAYSPEGQQAGRLLPVVAAAGGQPGGLLHCADRCMDLRPRDTILACCPATGPQIKQGVDLPNWVAYLSSSLTFGGGLLGISYGIMSGAWRAADVPARLLTPAALRSWWCTARMPAGPRRCRLCRLCCCPAAVLLLPLSLPACQPACALQHARSPCRPAPLPAPCLVQPAGTRAARAACWAGPSSKPTCRCCWTASSAAATETAAGGCVR